MVCDTVCFGEKSKLKFMMQTLNILISEIPFFPLRVLGTFLGLTAYALDKRHRSIVRHNLHFIFPEYSKERLTHLSRKIFINTAVTFLEILQLFCSSGRHLRNKMEIDDPSKSLALLINQTRLILITAHMGNWEVPNLFISKYFKKPIVSVVRPLDSEILNQIMVDFRTRYGSTLIDKKGALQKLARALRYDETIGLLIDQDIRPKEAIKAKLLGKYVNTTPSVAWLANRYACPVIPIFCVRKPNGKLVMKINPPLKLVKTQNPKDDILTNTQIINDSISNAIREYADQWFWFHKRWKRYYPEIYPEEIKRLARLKKKKAKKRQKIKKRSAKK